MGGRRLPDVVQNGEIADCMWEDGQRVCVLCEMEIEIDLSRDGIIPD